MIRNKNDDDKITIIVTIFIINIISMQKMFGSVAIFGCLALPHTCHTKKQKAGYDTVLNIYIYFLQAHIC